MNGGKTLLTSGPLRDRGRSHSSIPKPARRRAATSWCDRVCQQTLARCLHLSPLPCVRPVPRGGAISRPRIQFLGALRFYFFSQSLEFTTESWNYTFYQILLDASVRACFFQNNSPFHQIRKRPRPAWFVDQRAFLSKLVASSSRADVEFTVFITRVNRIQLRGQIGNRPPSSSACGLRTRRSVLVLLLRCGSLGERAG